MEKHVRRARTVVANARQALSVNQIKMVIVGSVLALCFMAENVSMARKGMGIVIIKFHLVNQPEVCVPSELFMSFRLH